MPKVNFKQFATRTIKVPLTFEDDAGQRLTEEFAVKYRSFSPKVAAEMVEAEKDETNRSLAKSLATIVISIPEILDGNAPMVINEENLSNMSGDNLSAIYRGVLSDINPTETPSSAASPVTSEPAGTAE